MKGRSLVGSDTVHFPKLGIRSSKSPDFKNSLLRTRYISEVRIGIAFMRIRIHRITHMQIQIRPSTFILIRILIMIKLMRIFDHWSTDTPRLYFISSRHSSIVSVHGSILILFLILTSMRIRVQLFILMLIGIQLFILTRIRIFAILVHMVRYSLL
jgi:hypothetical protein